MMQPTGTVMQPTNFLRFVRRHIDSDNGPGNKSGRMLMILQQKWGQLTTR